LPFFPLIFHSIVDCYSHNFVFFSYRRSSDNSSIPQFDSVQPLQRLHSAFICWCFLSALKASTESPPTRAACLPAYSLSLSDHHRLAASASQPEDQPTSLDSPHATTSVAFSYRQKVIMIPSYFVSVTKHLTSPLLYFDS